MATIVYEMISVFSNAFKIVAEDAWQAGESFAGVTFWHISGDITDSRFRLEGDISRAVGGNGIGTGSRGVWICGVLGSRLLHVISRPGLGPLQFFIWDKET